MHPMLPVSGGLPVGADWIYEVDWAGVRLMADVDEGRFSLHTADGDDVTARFPEFAGLSDAVADGMLDGEAVMLDGGSPSALALGERLRIADARKARGLARERPAVFMVYDVLRLYGVDLTGRPLEERRAVLGRLDLSRATRIQVSPAYDDGSALLAGVVDQRLSGVIAKRRGSAYRSGDAAGDWVRVLPDAGAHRAGPRRASGTPGPAGPSEPGPPDPLRPGAPDPQRASDPHGAPAPSGRPPGPPPPVPPAPPGRPFTEPLF